jgi:selenocysteine-specific elongation factor
VRARVLGAGYARLRLAEPLPLRVGDRAVLRDPGSRRVWGVRVLDPSPPPLGRRGAAAARASALAEHGGTVTGVLAVRGAVRLADLRRWGVPADPLPAGAVVDGEWLLSAEEAAARAAGRPAPAPASTPEDEAALAGLAAHLADAPFAAPDAATLAALGLDDAAAVRLHRAGLVLRVAPGVVLLPGADDLAVRTLAALEQPFTTSAARQALGTSRRVVLPLLAHLDRTGRTVRLADDTRRLRGG